MRTLTDCRREGRALRVSTLCMHLRKEPCARTYRSGCVGAGQLTDPPKHSWPFLVQRYASPLNLNRKDFFRILAGVDLRVSAQVRQSSTGTREGQQESG